jgi:hypothetical protein
MGAALEFRLRHGATEQVDEKYIRALYRDGLGREPEPELLAKWLNAGQTGTTRAEILTAIAGLPEVLQRFTALSNSLNWQTSAGLRQTIHSRRAIARQFGLTSRC